MNSKELFVGKTIAKVEHAGYQNEDEDQTGIIIRFTFTDESEALLKVTDASDRSYCSIAYLIDEKDNLVTNPDRFTTHTTKFKDFDENIELEDFKII
jgi:hypothetical protein